MTLAAEDIRSLESATAGGAALRWSVSALAVATAYAAVIWVALALPPPEGVQGDLQDAVMIELEPLTALEEAPPPAPEPEVEEAAAEPAPTPPELQAEPLPEPPEPAVAPEPVPDPPTPEPVVEPPPPEPAPPEPVVEPPLPEPEPVVEPPPPEPEPIVEPAPLPEPPREPLPEPTTQELVPDLTETSAIAAAVLNPPVPTLRPPPPRPRVETAEKPRTERSKPVEKPKRPAERPKKAAPRKPVAQAEARPQRSAAPRSDSRASSRSAQAPRVSSASWQRQAVSHFRKFRRRMETRERGTARVAVTIDRGGRVVGARLASSSGSAALDGEALALVRRASPIPAPPEGVGGRTLQLTVPVSM